MATIAMNTTKLLTVLVAALVVSAGAGAVSAQTATETSADTNVDASYDDGTVTLTVTQNGTAVENVSVEANDETVGTTDANGTLAFETNATEELELEISSGEQELEQEYVLEDGELVREEDDDEDEEVELSADVSYDNGTVDVTVTRNGSAVENATVAANGEDVGTTGANGTLTFETNATEELEIEITAGEGELELEYEDGELVEESDEDDEAGPSENASDRAKGVFGAIQTWLDGGQEGSLGQLIQETLGNGNDDAPGNSGNDSDEAPGNSANASNNGNNGNGNAGEAPGHDDDDDSESEDESEDEADEEEDEADEEDDEADEEDDEADEEDDENPGKGNGNGNN